MIEFLLHNELVSIEDIDPNTTVLEYLREHRQRTGTKEGCASGDCGACTVVVAEIDRHSDQLLYKNINACITFMSALNARQLITVEDLKHNQKLHYCQQAMVDTDGSQCGFCTPGFVMSLFALHKAENQYDRYKVQEALAGNLCRCTGYGAIDKAAQQALQEQAPDQFSLTELKTVEKLQQIMQRSKHREAFLAHADQHCHMPKSINSLAQILTRYPNANIVAGGTDLSLNVTQQGQKFKRLIDIHQVPELNIFKVTREHIEIGAAVSLDQCQTQLADFFPDFSALLERFASLQVRHQGTLGGNIANASPIGDTPPALIALSAELVLRKDAKTRRIPLQDFFIDYRKTQLQASEFIEKIILPLPNDRLDGGRTIFKVYKVSKRLDDDISAICAASWLLLDKDHKVLDIKLAYGGMAAIPKRAYRTEAALLGNVFDQQSLASAIPLMADDFQPLSDFRASSQYRLRVAQNLLQKLYIESADDLPSSAKTRISDYV